jgi:hypothetical protein
MARTGRTYQSKRKPAHMASEAARLRKMVQEREDENKRLREALRRVIDVGPEALDGNIGAGPGGKIRRICKDALDGGGESS